MTPPTYEIRTVADFLAVPIERLETCLEEFQLCIAMVHLTRVAAPQTTLDRFTWIDDGERNVNARVVMHHHESVEVGGATTPKGNE